MANIHSLPPCGSIYHHCVCVLVCVCVCVCVSPADHPTHTKQPKNIVRYAEVCVCVCVRCFVFGCVLRFFFGFSSLTHTHTHWGNFFGRSWWWVSLLDAKKKREKLSKKKKIPRNVGLFSFFFHFRGLRRPQWGARGADYDFIFVFLDPFFLVVCVCVWRIFNNNRRIKKKNETIRTVPTDEVSSSSPFWKTTKKKGRN